MDLFKQEAFKTGYTSRLQLLFKNLSDDHRHSTDPAARDEQPSTGERSQPHPEADEEPHPKDDLCDRRDPADQRNPRGWKPGVQLRRIRHELLHVTPGDRRCPVWSPPSEAIADRGKKPHRQCNTRKKNGHRTLLRSLGRPSEIPQRDQETIGFGPRFAEPFAVRDLWAREAMRRAPVLD